MTSEVVHSMSPYFLFYQVSLMLIQLQVSIDLEEMILMHVLKR